MSAEERWEMLSKEELKFNCVGTFEMTKEDEIRGLNGLINCMREFEHKSEEELNQIYEEEIKKIEEKYSTQK